MRILFLAHRLPYPPNKGDKIRSFWELTALREHHDVDLFCFYDDPQDRFQVTNLSGYCNSCYAERLSAVSSRVRALYALVRGRSFSAAFFYSRSMARQVASALRSERYDLIFVFGSAMAQYAESCPELPKILDLVDVDSDKWLQYSKHSRGLLSWFWKMEGKRLQRYEATLVQAFSNTLVCTDAEAQLLRSSAPNGRTSVLQNCLDMDYYRPETVLVPEEIRSLQPYVLFTGTMDYFPNVDAVQFFCQEILPLVRARVPQLRFVIAGRNPTATVMRLAGSYIHVTGTVSDIRPYLRGAAVAVAPMRIARGVQNKILEALAMDVPVVASSAAAGALPQELASLVAAENEPEMLANRIVDYLVSPSERTGTRRKCVQRYIDDLGLSSQLEKYLCGAAVAPAGGRREREVRVAV